MSSVSMRLLLLSQSILEKKVITLGGGLSREREVLHIYRVDAELSDLVFVQDQRFDVALIKNLF
jgi:hypothetical protein